MKILVILALLTAILFNVTGVDLMAPVSFEFGEKTEVKKADEQSMLTAGEKIAEIVEVDAGYRANLAPDYTGKKLVALTFDDGPHPECTPQLLAVLSEKGVKATFFMLGLMVERHPQVAAQVAAAGHEVENHTMWHQNMVWISAENVREDVSRARAAIEAATGVTPQYVRLPYGLYNDTVMGAMETPVIAWSVDPRDWASERTVEGVSSGVVEATFDGAIILLHDIYPTTVGAVAIIIDTLREQGYEFVTVAELARAKGVTLERGVEYRSF